LTVLYCTADDVARFLSFRQNVSPAGFTDSTVPSKGTVESYIEMAQDYIDRATRHSWRWQYNPIPDYEYHSVEYMYQRLTGIPIYLRHRDVHFPTTQELGLGEVASVARIEMFNGSDYEIWFDGANPSNSTKTQGRNADWWVDTERGVLWIRNFIWLWRPLGIRVKYYYGKESATGDIKMATVMLVAKWLLMGEDRSVLLPEGTSNVTYREKIELWDKEIKEILDRNTEYAVITS